MPRKMDKLIKLIEETQKVLLDRLERTRVAEDADKIRQDHKKDDTYLTNLALNKASEGRHSPSGRVGGAL